MKADRNGARLPAWTGSSVSLCFPGRFRAQWQTKCIVKAKFIGNQPQFRWLHYSKVITLCNQHALHNDTLSKMCNVINK